MAHARKGGNGRGSRLLLLTLVCLEGRAAPVWAHGFGQRYALPVPLWLYVSGAAAAVLFSFVVVGIFVRRPGNRHAYARLNLLRSPLGRAVAHPAVLGALQALSVALFVLLILTGLAGNPHPMRNLAPTLVWIVWWVGLAYVSALAGNLWALLNPLAVLFRCAERLYHRVRPAGTLGLNLPYPRVLDRWPGVLLFLAFAWTELVFEGSAVPSHLALLTLVYTGITWLGMVLFGRDQWLWYGDAFTLAFGLLSRFAPTEVRVIDPDICRQCRLDCRDQNGECIDCYACFRQARPAQREWNLRPFGVGLLHHRAVSVSEMLFVMVILATVTFDGVMATPLWAQTATFVSGRLPALGGAHLTLIKTLGLLIFPILFFLVYLLFGWMMARCSGSPLSAGALARHFVFTLVPIAIAYHMAHYFSFFLIQGQFIVPLLSDPFGFGWDLLGTAAYRPNVGIVGARFAWFTAVVTIVVGHIMAVYLAHLVAVRTLPDRFAALYSQYPMLVLMVGYTMVSLWILAQPIVEQAVSPAVTAGASPGRGIDLPPDALLPEAGSGRLREVGEGRTAAAKITYRVLTSAFHDGTPVSVADLLYPYIFAYRWGVRGTAEAQEYDVYVARATAVLRERLVGFRVMRIEKREIGFGQLKLARDIPVIEVYVNYVAADSSQVAALAPPWSSLPWPLLVLMEAAVQRGWAAFSAEAARQQGVKWLDLVRDRSLTARLASLVKRFAQRGYVPEVLQGIVTEETARRRWSALQRFYQAHGHFLVTNGPYKMAQWSESTTVLKVFRDMSYPLGVGSYDRYAIPRRAYITQVTRRDQGIEVRAEVESVEKFQRTYEIIRRPLRQVASTGKPADLPRCRYLVVDAAGTVVHSGTAPYLENGFFFVDLKGVLLPGRYTVMIALYVRENEVNAEIKTVSYEVGARS